MTYADYLMLVGTKWRYRTDDEADVTILPPDSTANGSVRYEYRGYAYSTTLDFLRDILNAHQEA